MDPVFLALGTRGSDDPWLKDPQRWNSYAYGRDNPYRMVDPDGQAFWDVVRAFNNAARAIVNIATSVLPIVSDYRDFVEATSGRNMVTGRQLSTNEMSLTTGALLIPGIVSGGELRAVNGASTALDSLSISKKYLWGNPRSLEGHFVDHGYQFGAQDSADYARIAREFYERGMADVNVLRKVDSNTGVIRMYEPSSNTFGAYNGDGTARTIFKPDPAAHGRATNMDYWDDQPGELH